jgi:Zn finger protein HypA/HybF involved in hydrogenase expression
MIKSGIMNSNDTPKETEFIDSACTCKTCDHKIATECLKSNCSCCKAGDHSMVLDGIEGFHDKQKIV